MTREIDDPIVYQTIDGHDCVKTSPGVNGDGDDSSSLYGMFHHG